MQVEMSRSWLRNASVFGQGGLKAFRATALHGLPPAVKCTPVVSEYGCIPPPKKELVWLYPPTKKRVGVEDQQP